MEACPPATKMTAMLAPELLLMIVQHVDDRPTLYALLTTSKVLFDAAVRRLYLDPFAYADHSPDVCAQLCDWIITLSTSTRQEVETLRAERNIASLASRLQSSLVDGAVSEGGRKGGQGGGKGGGKEGGRKGGQEEGQEKGQEGERDEGQVGREERRKGERGDGGASEGIPYVNYLSFVRHVEIQFTGEYDYQAAVELKQVMLPALPWAVCADGQFSQLTTISIVSAQASSFLPTIPSMTRLQTVIWDPTPYHKSRDMSGIRRFVEAFVAAHGARGRKLIMFFETCQDLNDEEDFDEIDGVIPELVDIYRMLDPFPPTKHSIIRGNSWMRCLAHKDQMDFGNILEIDVNFDEELEMVLPRCHRLESLRCEDGLISTRIFRWAAEIRDRILEEQGSQHQQDLPSLPPLKKIDLFVDRAVIATTMRDIRHCFTRTLESVELCFTSSTELFAGLLETQDQEQDEFSTYVGGARVLRVGPEWKMPHLQHLRLYGTDTRCFVSVDAHMGFVGMPNLQTLVLGDSSSLHEDPEELYHDDEHEPDLVDDAMIRQLVLEPCRIWNLPNLRELGLRGASAAQFNPDTLFYTRELEDLTLNLRSAYLNNLVLASRWRETADMRLIVEVARPDDVGWHWPLPNLKRLFLSGHGACTFHIGAFDILPVLEQATLVVSDRPDYCGSLRSFLTLGASTPETRKAQDLPSTPAPASSSDHENIDSNSNSGDDLDAPNMTYSQLRYLYLKGRWEMARVDLSDLLDRRRFPQLQELWLTGVPWNMVEVVAEMVAKHPSLKLVWITTRDGPQDQAMRKEVLEGLELCSVSRRPAKEAEGYAVVSVDHDWFLKKRID